MNEIITPKIYIEWVNILNLLKERKNNEESITIYNRYGSRNDELRILWGWGLYGAHSAPKNRL